MKNRLKSLAGKLVVPALSILLALGVASILIIASGLVGSEKELDLTLPFVAYGALLQGAFGSIRGFTNMIVAAAPLMLTGLAVGVGLKAGLFNIGATWWRAGKPAAPSANTWPTPANGRTAVMRLPPSAWRAGATPRR